jgi:hypothetical protein
MPDGPPCPSVSAKAAGLPEFSAIYNGRLPGVSINVRLCPARQQPRSLQEQARDLSGGPITAYAPVRDSSAIAPVPVANGRGLN